MTIIESINVQSTEEKQRFASLIEPYRSALQAYCRSITPSFWDADDLVQETSLKAFRMFLREPSRHDMSKTYLFRIAHNTWIDQCRKRRYAIETLCAEKEYPVDAVDQVELRSAMETLIANLPTRQIVFLMLVDMFGFSALETAQFIRSSEGAVKAGLHRARTKLKSLSENAAESQDENLISADRRKVDEIVVYAYLQAFQQHNPYALVRLLNDQSQLDLAPVVVGSASAEGIQRKAAKKREPNGNGNSPIYSCLMAAAA